MQQLKDKTDQLKEAENSNIWLEDEIERLTKDLEQLTQQFEELEFENEQWKDENKQLKDKNEQLEDKTEQLKDETEQLEDKNEQLTDEKETLEKRIEDLGEQLSNLADENCILTKDVEEKTEQLKDLQLTQSESSTTPLPREQSLKMDSEAQTDPQDTYLFNEQVAKKAVMEIDSSKKLVVEVFEKHQETMEACKRDISTLMTLLEKDDNRHSVDMMRSTMQKLKLKLNSLMRNIDTSASTFAMQLCEALCEADIFLRLLQGKAEKLVSHQNKFANFVLDRVKDFRNNQIESLHYQMRSFLSRVQTSQ